MRSEEFEKYILWNAIVAMLMAASLVLFILIWIEPLPTVRYIMINLMMLIAFGMSYTLMSKYKRLVRK